MECRDEVSRSNEGAESAARTTQPTLKGPIVFLVSDAAALMTGTSPFVDGG